MKTKLNHITNMLLAVGVLLGLTARANEEAHKDYGGVSVALDNSRCPAVAIGHTYLHIYDTGGNLCAAYGYADARAVASALLPFDNWKQGAEGTTVNFK